MTPKQETEYRALETVQARAAWLLNQGCDATLDIDPHTLTPCWRIRFAGVMLPERYFGNKQEAFDTAEKWLRAMSQ